MTPRRDTRQVLLFRLDLRARPANGPKNTTGIEPYNLEDVIAALRAAMTAGKAISFYTANGAPHEGDPNDVDLIRVSLEDVVNNIDKRGKVHSYSLRFSYANPRAADPGKRDLKTGARETLRIEKGQAGDVGAHMVVAFPDTAGEAAGVCRCVLEQMTGLSRSKIVTLVQTVADAFMSEDARPTYEYYEKKKGRKKQLVKDTTRLRMHTFPERSESLADDLENGVLKEIQFLGEATETDALPQGLERPKQVIKATVVDSHRRGAKAVNLIKQAMAFAKERSMRAKLEIEKTADDDTVRHQTRELVLDQEGLADQLFARQATISPSDNLPMCYDKTNDDTLAALIDVLNNKKLWK